MVRIIKKRAYFLLGVAVSAVIGVLTGYIRSGYSKDDSWLVPPAKADLVPYTWDAGLCGDGCGGCSGGDSGDCSSGS
ncbi:MAG: hypothetical protein ACEQSB_03455 [Undibacterium sp.]